MTTDTRLSTDVLIIGWGKAGKTLAGTFARASRTVVLVERSPQMYGGTCINVACVLTKETPLNWGSPDTSVGQFRPGSVGR